MHSRDLQAVSSPCRFMFCSLLLEKCAVDTSACSSRNCSLAAAEISVQFEPCHSTGSEEAITCH